ncbi:hypothetical protein B1207_05560 [Legionella quinlivanii]|uniref:Substrate of the Dot/Icm secretion system n=1 Tax=Legionella quinlivanii TaxID=45073 RepID=A0A364LLM4_9GAMM|nr:hypothetical protein [Legionella quinlivanii]RAP37637.1 hypothetical protein B1207_05560 [Legionella quinlivanii]
MLKTTKRGSTVAENMPYFKAIKQAGEVASTPEAARYLVDQATKKMAAVGKLADAQTMLKSLEEYRQNVEMQRERPSPQSGDGPVRSDFQNLQHNLAEAAIEAIKGLAKGSIKLDYALNDQTKILRGFSVNGDIIQKGEPLLDALDKALNAWLAERNMVSKGSMIYECDQSGQIKKDSAGNPVKADPVKLGQMINDREQGFQKTLSSKGVDINVSQHRYPEKRAEAQQAAQAQQRQEPEPEAPTSSSGMGG